MEGGLVGSGMKERRDSHRVRSGTVEGGWRCQMLVFRCILVKYSAFHNVLSP
jgi:hypothetical protein